jgi:hypothetical protein
MEHLSFARIGGWYVRLLQITDEETWPSWLRAVLSVALVVFLFISGIVFLAVTP